eukprot:Tamp_01812.p1 GENE.Tamp_01812~~Tamp_01812.p1  ORF type:complete len:1494 (+),score=242.23 Tamp_01812:44-4483(+)
MQRHGLDSSEQLADADGMLATLSLGDADDLLKLVIDPDEGVRKDAVSAVLSACLLNSDSVPHTIVENVSERVLDKKASVRKLAMEGLAKLWQKYCAPVDASRLRKSLSDRFGWIPSKILMISSAEARSLVIHCIEDICLKPLNDERSAAAVAMDLVSDLDAKARDNLIVLLKLRGRFCDQFGDLCDRREEMATDMDPRDGEKYVDTLLQQASQSFPDPASAYDHLRQLHGFSGRAGIEVWQQLHALVKTPVNHEDTIQAQDEVLKLLGPKHPQLSFAETLIAKLSDKCFGVDFLRMVLDVVADEDSSSMVAAKKCLCLIPEIVSVNQRLVRATTDLLQWLLISRWEDTEVCQTVLRTIAVSGEQMTDLRESEACIATVKGMCMHDSWEVAKHAVRSLVALGCDDQGTLSEMSQEAVRHVSFGNKLPSALRTLTEVARVCPEAVEKDRETVSKFVRRRLLHGSWPASAGQKERHIVIDSKVQGLKLLTVFSFHDDEGNGKAALELLDEIISNGGEIQSGDGSTPEAERVTLRMTAGSCILKIAKKSTVQSLVSPSVFSTLSRLLEDEERTVKETILHKLYKGIAVGYGKLPFRFASLLTLVAHDTDPVVADRGRTFLRNTLMLMSRIKKQTGSQVVDLRWQHIVPWLLYLLVARHEYADPAEDVTLSYDKYFELFFNCVPEAEQNLLSVRQVLQFIRECNIPATAARASAQVVERRIAAITEVADHVLLHKDWPSRSSRSFFTASLPKVVDAAIFCHDSVSFSPSKVAGDSAPWRTASFKALVDSTLIGKITAIRNKTLELPLFRQYHDFAEFLTTALAPVNGMSFREFYGLYRLVSRAVPSRHRDVWLATAVKWLAEQAFSLEDMFPTLHGEGSVRRAVIAAAMPTIMERARRGVATRVCILGSALGEDGVELWKMLEAQAIDKALVTLTQRDIVEFARPHPFRLPVEVVPGLGIKSGDKFDVILASWVAGLTNVDEIHQLVHAVCTALTAGGALFFGEHRRNHAGRRALTAARHYVSELADLGAMTNVHEKGDEEGGYACDVLTGTALERDARALVMPQMMTPQQQPLYAYGDDGDDYVREERPLATVSICALQQSVTLGMVGVYWWSLLVSGAMRFYVGSSRDIHTRSRKSFHERNEQAHSQADRIVIVSLRDVSPSVVALLTNEDCWNPSMLDALKFMMERTAILEGMHRHPEECQNLTANTFSVLDDTDIFHGMYDGSDTSQRLLAAGAIADPSKRGKVRDSIVAAGAVAGMYDGSDTSQRLLAAGAIADPSKRGKVRDSIVAAGAVAGWGGRVVDTAARLELAQEISDPAKREHTTQVVQMAAARHTATSTIVQDVARGGESAMTGAKMLSERRETRIRRRNEQNDGNPSGLVMCLKPVHREHLPALQTDIAIEAGGQLTPVCAGVQRGTLSGRCSEHMCLGDPPRFKPSGRPKVSRGSQFQRCSVVRTDDGQFSPTVRYKRYVKDQEGEWAWT